MKKIILSVAVATMALSTVASALEDIKVSGQAKLWYETSDQAGSVAKPVVDMPVLGKERSGDLLSKDSSSGEVIFKLGMTGKQGNVGFGTTIYQASTMGLEGVVVGAARTAAFNEAMFVGEAYVTAPLIASTILKFGKQELDTPMAFTETWNALPNTFNAAVLVNNSVDNLTLIGAYIGQGNTPVDHDNNVTTANSTSFKVDGEVTDQYFGTAYAIAGLYKSDAFAASVWGYQINNVLGMTDTSGNAGTFLTHGGVSVNALWADASMKAGVVNLAATAAYVAHDGDENAVANVTGDATSAFALSADTKVSEVTLFAAASTVSEGDLPVANTATNFKKSKLPTEAVYTDGLYVAQPGSTAFKLKASGKLGSTGLALQGVMNNNSGKDNEKMGLAVSGVNTGFLAQNLETTEVDLIVNQKLGDFNLAAILMNRSFADSDMDDAQGGNYVRVIASVNF